MGVVCRWSFWPTVAFPDWTAQLIKELAGHGENGLNVVFSILTETSGGKEHAVDSPSAPLNMLNGQQGFSYGSTYLG